LCTTRIEGKLSHISFSDCVFGRISGINEHGLAVTSSLGSPLSEIKVAGLPYFIVSRILLDQCTTVAEALERIETLPIAWYSNYLLADCKGTVAQAEIACDKHAIRRYGPEDASALWATNHFTLPEMGDFAPHRMRQSLKRWEFLRAHLRSSTPIGRPHDLLASPFPEGLRFSHYMNGLGTLHSMVIDIDALTIDASFGPPLADSWHTFDLNQQVGSTFYDVLIEDVPAPKGFWATGS